MRFGTFLPHGWRLDLDGIPAAEQWPRIRDIAERLDDSPEWEGAWVYDHFHSAPFVEDADVHEAWSLVSALSAVTTRLRLGQMCTCMGYRKPIYLAKLAATADVISGGRVEMGIGAGWYEHEWRAYGYGFPSAGERIGMLDEGVQIMRQAWHTGTASLEGKHFQVEDARCHPLPLQPGGIPLWIAGGGEKKTLRVAAQYADYTNFDGTPEGFKHKSEVLAAHCDNVGREFTEITRSANYNVLIAETEADLAEREAWLRDKYTRLVGEEGAEAQLRSFVGMPGYGTPEQIVEKLTAMSDLGLDYAITYFPDLGEYAESLELFEKAVIPELQRA
ncbi:TIGR03560 family F420-dependent LLM class oxidoreductase [Dietzia sp.]|uniref:TIGR03560 family F420-dependent LLM class oxidoreductase n=1 Tax=Dietzia sp. TaxID=1871616 RepID=UPI002FDB0987